MKAAEVFPYYREPLWEIVQIFWEDKEFVKAQTVLREMFDIEKPEGVDVWDLGIY